MVSRHQMIFELLKPVAVLLEEKKVLCLILSLLDSVLFTYFQTVVAGWKVFQGKTKQVFTIFSKKSQPLFSFY
jgi:hypothetical protein